MALHIGKAYHERTMLALLRVVAIFKKVRRDMIIDQIIAIHAYVVRSECKMNHKTTTAAVAGAAAAVGHCR